MSKKEKAYEDKNVVKKHAPKLLVETAGEKLTDSTIHGC
jgi:hypothetical protein